MTRDTIKHALTAVSVLLLLLLAGCGSKYPDPPEMYEYELDSVISLDSIMEEEGGLLVQIRGMDDELSEETQAEDQIDTAVEDEAVYVYHYKQVPSPMALVQSYMDKLTAEDIGFVVTDDENIILEKVPALRNIRNRTLILARPSQLRGKTFRIALGWAEGTGTVYVAVSRIDGEILLERPAPPEPPEDPANNEPGGPESASVLTDQINYLYAQEPSRLGLEGESMSDYRIYYVGGIARIDGQNCHRFHVYARRQENTNGILGAYFLSADNESLYKLDIDAKQVTKLP